MTSLAIFAFIAWVTSPPEALFTNRLGMSILFLLQVLSYKMDEVTKAKFFGPLCSVIIAFILA